MFEKIRVFWNSFWNAIKTAYNKAFKDVPKENTQEYRDTKRINFLSVFAEKLTNLSCVESTYEIVSDSNQVERLSELCKDLEAKRFEIVAETLGNGDYWVFPATDKSDKLYHRYITQDRVRILEMDGEKITDLIGIIDEFVSSDNKVYFLNRRHTLNGNTLTIDTYTTNERNERVILPEWEEQTATYELQGVDVIGVGRFKSPKSSRGLSVVYGVPLNFGCEEIEAKIFKDLQMIDTEFDRAESKIFADPLILKKGKGKDGVEEWQMPEGMFPISHRAGDTGASIDIFSPTIRYSEYKEKLFDDLRKYEEQVGVDKGFVTPYDNGTYTNEAEVRRENANTITFIDNIHNAIKSGVEMTLKADAIFLNVADDLYSLKFDFFDPFENTEKQYERISGAVDRRTAERKDEIKWLFPNLDDEQIEEKILRIDEEAQTDTDQALERILTGQ